MKYHGCSASLSHSIKELPEDSMSIPEQYARAGRITREVRDWVNGRVAPGMGFVEVCDAIEKEIVARGGRPAFPTGIGVNQVSAHYAPPVGDGSTFRESDLIKIDFGTHIDGYVTDTSTTLSFNPDYEMLMEATKRALEAAIETARRDSRAGEIGRAIQHEATRLGFKTIENLTGHTIERYVVHAGKSIPNVAASNLPSLKKNDVFAIEPFLTLPTAAGYVTDAPTVTIYSVVARKRTGIADLDGLVEAVWEDRKTLPFTPRWYASSIGREKVARALPELVRRRIVRGYPTLVEASGGPVAQFEHTMALEESGLLVLT